MKYPLSDYIFGLSEMLDYNKDGLIHLLNI